MKINSDIKIIFVDIDWTLLNHSYKPARYDKKSIDALKKAQEKGVLIFICTARPYHSVEQINLFNHFTPDGMVVANGGEVFVKDKIIYKTEYPVKYFEKLCEKVLTLGLNLEGIREKDCFLISDNHEDLKELFSTYPEDIPPIDDYYNQHVIGVNFFAPESIDEEMKAYLKKESYYFRYHPHGVDLAYEPHIKGVGVNKALEYLNICKDNAMAIGDDLQDIEMFDAVKYKVAMKNGKEEVKQASNFVTKHINRHGVKHALKKHKVI